MTDWWCVTIWLPVAALWQLQPVKCKIMTAKFTKKISYTIHHIMYSHVHSYNRAWWSLSLLQQFSAMTVSLLSGFLRFFFKNWKKPKIWPIVWIWLVASPQSQKYDWLWLNKIWLAAAVWAWWRRLQGQHQW